MGAKKERDLLSTLREGSLLVRRFMATAKDVRAFKKETGAHLAISNSSTGSETERLVAFYKQRLGVNVEIGALRVPSVSSRFDLLLSVIPELTYEYLWSRWKSLFACSSPFENHLEDEMELDRENCTGRYLLRMSGAVECDEEHRGENAGGLSRKRVMGCTLREYMLAELWHFHTTRGGHLGLATSTLCMGSRFKDGTVPEVRFEGRAATIDWVKTSESRADLGIRQVIRGT